MDIAYNLFLVFGNIQDFDECKSSLHNCQHICLNTFGSYKCKCRPGFELSKDAKTCIGKSFSFKKVFKMPKITPSL